MRAFHLGAAFIALGVAACANNKTPDEEIGDPNDQMDQGSDPTDDTDPPTPDESARDNDELAKILGAHVRGEFAVQLVAKQLSNGVYPEGFYATGTNDAGEILGAGALGAMNFTFTLRCNNDDTAHAVVPCDGSTTTPHHSHMLWTMAGGETVGDMAMNDMNRQVAWEIRDIIYDKARFRGPDNIAVSTSVTGADGRAATYTLNMDAAYEKVRYLASDVVPTFGTIDFNINAERLRDADRRVFETTAHLEYGVKGAPTLLTIGGSVSYSIDLATGAVVKL